MPSRKTSTLPSPFSSESETVMTSPSNTSKTSDRRFSIRGRVIIGAVATLALVGGMGGWAATTKLAGAVVIQGTVTVDDDLKVVQHKMGGIVGSIQVKEGQHVTEGQVLFVLDDAQAAAEQSIVTAQLLELEIRRNRLVAERDLMNTYTLPAKLATDLRAVSEKADEVIEGERRLFEGNLNSRLSRKEQLLLGKDQVRNEIEGLKAQLVAKDQEIALVGTESETLDSLSGKKLVLRAALYSISREEARLDGERGEIVSAIARAESRIGEIDLQVLSIDDTTRTEAQRELRTVEATLSELEDRKFVIEDTLARTTIRAPITGWLNEVSVTSEGGVIAPAQVLASIVPEDAVLTVSGQVPAVQIEQVHQDQPARLRFTAFNQRVTPEVAGRVSYIAAAATFDEQMRSSAYRVDIAMFADDLALIGEEKLRPGMPVEIYLTTEDRTALSYLLKPFTDQITKAFRER
jgi:HlyD family secretion protein